MLARSWFRLERPLRWEDEITIRTWHRGGKSAIMYRDYDIFCNGEQVGESVSGWVLASVDTHRLMRLGDVTELAGTSGGELCKTMTLAKLHHPARLEEVERRRMRYSDTDINGHVNNIRYADFACDAVEAECMKENTFLAEMQIGYLAECRPGQTLSIQVGGQGDGRYVRGVDEEGTPRFESVLYFQQLS